MSRLIRAVPRFWQLDLVTKLLLAIWYSVCEDNPNARVQIEATPRRTTDVQMDEIPQDGLVLGIFRGVQRCFWAISPVVLAHAQRHVDYRTRRVTSLPDECLGARLHIAEVIRDEEQLHCSLVWVLDDDLQLALLRNSVAPTRRAFGGFRSAVLFLSTAPHVGVRDWMITLVRDYSLWDLGWAEVPSTTPGRSGIILWQQIFQIDLPNVGTGAIVGDRAAIARSRVAVEDGRKGDCYMGRTSKVSFTFAFSQNADLSSEV